MVWRKFGAKTLQDAFKTLPRGSQDASRTPQDGICLFLRANLEPCWPPFSAQDGPRTFQDASKRPCWGCLGASLERLRASWRSRADKSVPWSRLGLILGGFWEVFGRFLADVHWFVWSIFNWLFDHFSVDFWLIPSRIRSTVYSTVYGNVYSTAYSLVHGTAVYSIQCCIQYCIQ